MGDMQGDDVVFTWQTEHITDKNLQEEKFKLIEAEFLQKQYDLAHLHPLKMQAMAKK